MTARCLNLIVAAMMLAAVVGCAAVAKVPMKRADLGKIHFVRIEPLANDQHGMASLIAADLKARGFEVEVGDGAAKGRKPDAILCFQDRWMWDLSMYLLSLDVQLRNARTRVILAQGQSYQPSLERKPPEAVVHRLLDEVFGSPPASPSAPPAPAPASTR